MDNFCILRKMNCYFFAVVTFIFRSLCGPDFIQYYCTVAVLAVFIPSCMWQISLWFMHIIALEYKGSLQTSSFWRRFAPCAELPINTVRFTVYHMFRLRENRRKSQFRKNPRNNKKRCKRQTERVNAAFLMFLCNADPQCNIQEQLIVKIDSAVHTLSYTHWMVPWLASTAYVVLE